MTVFRDRALILFPVTLVLIAGLVGCHGGGQNTVAPIGAVVPTVSSSQAALLGDLNGNGTPDVADAIGILRIVVGLDAANPLADCDDDGNVGVGDAIALLRCVVGLDEWPIGEPGPALGDEQIGPDGQTLVWVPAGSYMMGDEAGWIDEKPVHQVTLDGFWIGKCEVTNAQYGAFCDATDRAFPSFSDQGDDHPIVYLPTAWYDAKAYCDYYGYVLPTEAQWEYVARGPDVPVYPWGNVWDGQKCCYDENQGPGGRTFPVGSFPEGASWCGALDITGNVWEWCADWYLETYYQESPELSPPGPASGTSKVLRGGSWNSGSHFRAAHRHRTEPVCALYDCGFRVAMVAAP